MRVGVGLLAAAMLGHSVFPGTSVAQATSPFHRAQRGAEFRLGGFSGIGFLRFRAPDRATVFNVAADVRELEDSAAGPTYRLKTHDLRGHLGLRRYRVVRSDVVAYRTIGVSASYSHQRLEGPFAGPTSANGAGGGLFADFGAQWLVDTHLSLGAEWAVSAEYLHRWGRAGSAKTSGREWTFAAGGVSIIGTLYF